MIELSFSRSRSLCHLSTLVVILLITLRDPVPGIGLFIFGGLALISTVFIAIDSLGAYLPIPSESHTTTRILRILTGTIICLPMLILAATRLIPHPEITLLYAFPSLIVIAAVITIVFDRVPSRIGLPTDTRFWFTATVAAAELSALFIGLHIFQGTFQGIRPNTATLHFPFFAGTFALSVFLIIPWSARISARAGSNFSGLWSLATLIVGIIIIEADHRILSGLYPYSHIWLQCIGLATLDAAVAPWLTRASLTRIKYLAGNNRFELIATSLGCLALVAIFLGALHFAMFSIKEDDSGMRADLLASATGTNLLEIWGNEPTNDKLAGFGQIKHPLLEYQKYHAEPYLENDFNILLISIDALRGDVLKPGSNKWSKYAPNMRALSTKCANFTHTYAPGNRTAVGMGTLMLGRFSANISWDLWIWHRGRMYNPKTTSKTRLAKIGDNHIFSTMAEIPPEGNLAQRLRRKGFTTMAMPFSGRAQFFSPGFGFAKGYDHYVDLSREDLKQPSSMEVIERALEQQRNHASGRWFQWIHLYDPHQSKGNKKKYGTLVKSTDTAISALLAHLKRKHLLEKTAIFIVADHGEALGGHRSATHASTLYDDQTRVPLVACIPGQKPGIFTDPASTIDATATILALADADLSGIDGVNLLPAIARGKYPQNRPIFIEHHRYVSKDGSRTSDSKAVVLNNWKLIHNRKKRAIQLFNLAADPGEEKNLVKSKKHKTTLKKLKDVLDIFIHNGELEHPLP